MRCLTGGGLRGLAGIPPVRGKIIRPLLGTFRRSIEEYCRAMGLAYRIDASNLKPTYLRNRIRLQLIPYLEEEYNPRLREHLVALADILRGEEELFGRRDEELYRALHRPQAMDPWAWSCKASWPCRTRVSGGSWSMPWRKSRCPGLMPIILKISGSLPKGPSGS